MRTVTQWLALSIVAMLTACSPSGSSIIRTRDAAPIPRDAPRYNPLCDGCRALFCTTGCAPGTDCGACRRMPYDREEGVCAGCVPSCSNDDEDYECTIAIGTHMPRCVVYDSNGDRVTTSQVPTCIPDPNATADGGL